MNFTSQRTKYFELVDGDPDGLEVIIDDRLDIVQVTNGVDNFQMRLSQAKKFAEFILEKVR